VASISYAIDGYLPKSIYYCTHYPPPGVDHYSYSETLNFTQGNHSLTVYSLGVVLPGNRTMFWTGNNSTVYFTLDLTPETTNTTTASEDSWKTKAAYQASRYAVSLAVANGKIYALGGCLFIQGGVPCDFNQEYDPLADIWVTRKAMPSMRGGTGVAVNEGEIYVFGGSWFLSGSGTNSVWVYNPTVDTWNTSKTPMPTERYGMDANAVDGKIYLMGGTSNEAIRINNGLTYEVTNTTQVYDVATDTWITKAPMPTPVTDYASAVVDGKIYIIGGLTRAANSTKLSLVNVTQIYDAKTDTWQLGAPIPNAVSGLSAAATSSVMVPKRIYVVGKGFNQVYDPAEDNWTLATPMQRTNRMENFADVVVTCVDDQLYAVGGVFKGENGTYYSVNDQYTPIGYSGTGSSPLVSTSKPSEASVLASPNPSLAASPSPTVPEFSPLAVLIVAAAVGSAAFALRRGQH
jgi:N-acetylneuraminic acid mutarotase